MATPSVPPSSRVVSLTAEPTPAFSCGSEPMIASVAGAVVSPSPTAMSTIAARRDPSTSVSAPTSSRPHERRSPSRSGRRRRPASCPTRSTSRGATGRRSPARDRERQGAHAGARASSSRARTGSTGSTMKMKPNRAKNATATGRWPALNRGWRRRRTSSIGSSIAAPTTRTPIEQRPATREAGQDRGSRSSRGSGASITAHDEQADADDRQHAGRRVERSASGSCEVGHEEPAGDEGDDRRSAR